MGRKILIIGGGVAGITCANLLCDNNEVWLLEKEGELGGLCYELSCKATSKCNYCGWCLADEEFRYFNNYTRNNIKLFFNHDIKASFVKGSKHEVGIKSLNDSNSDFYSKFDYVLIASGANEFNPKEKYRLGYQSFENVLSGHEVDKNLRQFDFSDTDSVAFIQCVGSRDETIGALYCSKVCCRYATRIANYIDYFSPETSITFFYMDMQVQGYDIQNIYKALRKKKKVNFIRGIPSYITQNSDYKLQMRFEDTEGLSLEDNAFDKVILSVGFQPNKDNLRLSRILGVNLDQDGFIETDNNFMTNIDGIYSVGTSSKPSKIQESIASSKKLTEVLP